MKLYYKQVPGDAGVTGQVSVYTLRTTGVGNAYYSKKNKTNQQTNKNPRNLTLKTRRKRNLSPLLRPQLHSSEAVTNASFLCILLNSFAFAYLWVQVLYTNSVSLH